MEFQEKQVIQEYMFPLITCPQTGKIYLEPVVSPSDGETYEASLAPSFCTPNNLVKKMIQTLLSKYPSFKEYQYDLTNPVSKDVTAEISPQIDHLEEDDNDENNKNSKTSEEEIPRIPSRQRIFKVTKSDGTSIGRYTGNTPKQAASKTYARIIQEKTQNNEETTNMEPSDDDENVISDEEDNNDKKNNKEESECSDSEDNNDKKNNKEDSDKEDSDSESDDSESDEESEEENQRVPQVNSIVANRPRDHIPPRQRFFKLIGPDSTGIGRYTGNTPRQAASKAFTRLIQEKKRNNVEIANPTTVRVRECTRGSPRKEFVYSCDQVELSSPQSLVINLPNGENKTITYRYRNQIHKIDNNRETDEPNESDEPNDTDESEE